MSITFQIQALLKCIEAELDGTPCSSASADRKHIKAIILLTGAGSVNSPDDQVDADDSNTRHTFCDTCLAPVVMLVEILLCWQVLVQGTMCRLSPQSSIEKMP